MLLEFDTYIFNKNADEHGNHEVHKDYCKYCPLPENQVTIGYFSSCQDAIKQAKFEYPNTSFDGCIFCSAPCHQG